MGQMKPIPVVNVMVPKRIHVIPVQEVEKLDVPPVVEEARKDVQAVEDPQKKDVGVAQEAVENHPEETAEQYIPNVVLVAEEEGIHVVLAVMDM